MSLFTLLRCDECGRMEIPVWAGIGPRRPKGHQLRAEAHDIKAWKVQRQSIDRLDRNGWRDFCPECWRSYQHGDRHGVASPGKEDQ